MKKLAIIFIVVFTSGMLWDAGGHVVLDYPQGGEMFYTGEIVTITWTLAIPHAQENWDLYISVDDGINWDTIVLDLPVEILQYEWSVPDLITSEARIMILQDNQGTDYFAISDKFSINVATPSTIEGETDNEEFIAALAVFPVPFSGNLDFSFELLYSGNVTIEIYDLNGRKIITILKDFLEPGNYSYSWDAGMLKTGNYLFRVTTGGMLVNRKIICL